jgi:hypothetical protein
MLGNFRSPRSLSRNLKHWLNRATAKVLAVVKAGLQTRCEIVVLKLLEAAGPRCAGHVIDKIRIRSYSLGQ